MASWETIIYIIREKDRILCISGSQLGLTLSSGGHLVMSEDIFDG